MWYLCRVYKEGVRDGSDRWFPRVPVIGDSIDVGNNERTVLMVQLRAFASAPDPGMVAAIVYTD